MAVASVNINAVDNMSATLANLQQQLNNLQQQANNIVINPRAGNAAGNAFTNLNAQARILESTMNRLGNVVWGQFVSALKDAYQEIKNIDDELVVVRRVTGKTSKELEGMTKNAFDVAQRYGVSASDYLHGVAQFTRAGYGEQAEGLAELSVQLQRAGDVSATVADQYMTAVDKAYNMQGSVEALTAAMDGANQIGNEYATTVGEIAAGIGKVASIAATGHVGIDELTAALGTITAVTQRSGTEAATALRAIFLNIMGNTQTEIEEGAKWTAGEIEGLRQVLELYAPDVVAAAEATNTLIDPMEAIGALAKSYQDGILTESKLFTMVSDIGGKLRTNQLMVLIKNWDMYQSMLGTFANASGSISREIANSMDSITVKTEQLSAAWVALVNDSMSTGMIKGFLDTLIDCVNAAGNLQTVLGLVLGIVTTLKAQRLGTLFAGIAGGGANAGNIAAGIRGVGIAMAVVSAAVMAVNAVIQKYHEQIAKLNQVAIDQSSKAATSSNEITKLYTAYISATAGSKEYETALRALAEALGLTAEQAANAGANIHSLTQEQLARAASDAKAAMEEWSYNQSQNIPYDLGSWIGKAWEMAQKAVTSGISGITDDLSYLMLDYTGKKMDVSTVVMMYEQVADAQRRMRDEAAKTGGKVTDMAGYNELTAYLGEMKAVYDEALTLLNNYTTAQANASIVSMAAFSQITQTEAEIASGAEASEKAISNYTAAIDALATSFNDGTFLGQKMYEAVLKQFAQMFPNLIKYSKEYQKYMGTDSAEGLADGANDAANAVKTLAVALSTATKAKSEFDKAMENTPKENAGFADYQSAYSAYAAEIEAGRVNSAIAMAAAKYLMAGSGQFNFDEIYAQGGYKGVNAAMKKGPWKTVFGDAEEEYGEGFLDLLAKTANKAGQIMDSTGQKVIGTYKQTKDGIEFTIDDMLELSKVTGLSLDQIWQSVQALGVYGETGHTGVESMIDSLTQMGKDAGVAATETGKLSVDYGKLLQFMKDSGKTEQDWNDMKQWLDFLNEIGMIDLTNVPDVEGGWQNYADWVKEAGENAEEAAEGIEHAGQAMEDAAGEGGGTVELTVDDDGVREGIDDAEKNLADLSNEPHDIEVTFVAQILNFTRSVSIARDLLKSVATEWITNFIANTGTFSQKVQLARGLIQTVAQSWETYFSADTGTLSQKVQLARGLIKTVAQSWETYFSADTGTLSQKVQLARGLIKTVAQSWETYFSANTGTLSQKIQLARGLIQTVAQSWSTEFGGHTINLAQIVQIARGLIKTVAPSWVTDFTARTGTLSQKIQLARGLIQTVAKSWVTDFTAKTGTLSQKVQLARGLIQTVVKSWSTEFTAKTGTLSQKVQLARGLIQTVAQSWITEFNARTGTLSQKVQLARGLIQTVAKKWFADIEARDTGISDQLTLMMAKLVIPPIFIDIIPNISGFLNDMTGLWGDLSTLLNPGASEQSIFTATYNLMKRFGGLKTPSETPPSTESGTGEQTVEIETTVDTEHLDAEVDAAVGQAQADADATPVKLKTIPDLDGAFPTEQNQFFDENGNPVITAQFEVELENGDAVVDYLSYIDEVTGEEHVIKIMTESDGTQTIEETVTDAEGLQKTYVTTIDAEGNAVTTLETAEALATSLERVVTLTANANGNANARLNDLWNSYRKLNGKKLTITTVVEGDTLPDVEGNAKGTDSFKGGLSLINEDGPELIAANGWAKILGHGDPTVANIPKGARIYTAEETARILNGVGGEKFWAFANGVDGRLYGDVTIPTKPKEEPKEEPKTPSGGGSSGGSSKDDKNEFWDTIKEYLEYGLKKIEYSIKEYEMSVTLLERARDKILKPILDELATLEYTMSMLSYEVKLLERARDDAVKPLDEQIEKLKEARQISKEDEALEEKKLAVEEARANLLDVMHQRTVRYFNDESGQWEWMVDHKAVQQAQEQLDKAEKDYEDAQADYEITLLERQKADIEKTYQEQIDALQAQIDEMDRRKEDLEHEQEKITYEYDQSIKPLQEKMDDLQAVYDDLQYYYDRLVDAVEVPTESLSAALTQMGHAAEQYSSQLQDTVKLLDTLYELAPTFSAIEMGDLGQYAAQQSHMGDYKTDDHSQTVYIERMQVFGEKGRMLGDALRNAGIYRT